MNKHLRRLILLGVILFLLCATFFAGHFSRAHNRLQAYKDQLRARGEKLTFEQLALDYPTNLESKDSLTAFANAVAGIGNFPFQPSTLEIRKYVAPGQARPVWMVDHPWGNSKVTASQDTWDDFAAELVELKATLAGIRESLKNPPAATAPPTAPWAGPGVPNFVAIRKAAQWLAGATLCEVRQGKLEEALEDLEALAALARMNRNEPTLVAQMIRVAVTGLGLATTWECLQAPGWNPPQLERMQKAWESVDLIDGLEKSFLAERARGTELWATLRSDGGSPKVAALISGSSQPSSPQAAFERFTSEHVWLPLYRLTSIDDDELLHLQAMQEVIDALRLVKGRNSWKQARLPLDQTLSRITQTARSWQRFRYPFSMMAIPNSSKASETAVRTETERALAITAIALKRFQLRYGSMPKSLGDLLPEFLSEAPYDPISGEPLRYRLSSNGDFRLYSVGEDGRDDGGDPTPVASKFGLWDGRDAVWPILATEIPNRESH